MKNANEDVFDIIEMLFLCNWIFRNMLTPRSGVLNRI